MTDMLWDRNVPERTFIQNFLWTRRRKQFLEPLSILDANVIVRFPPNETVTLTDLKKPSNFYYDTPGYSFEANLVTTREVTKEDNEKLIDELVFADVVVCGPS